MVSRHRQELMTERSRATAAEQAVNELHNTVAQLKQRLVSRYGPLSPSHKPCGPSIQSNLLKKVALRFL